jgi:hypothetical protein
VVIPLNGDVFLTWRNDVAKNPEPNPLVPSSSAKFHLQAQSATNMPATFALRADVVDATAALPADFVRSIAFLTESGTVLTGNAIELGKTETRNIDVQLPALPANFANQSFTLVVTVEAGDVTNTFRRTFTVNAPVANFDPNITANRTGFTLLDVDGNAIPLPAPDRGELKDGTIRLKPEVTATVIYALTLTGAADKYDFTVTPKTGTTLTKWTLKVVGTINPMDGPVANRTAKFTVAAARDATTTPRGTLVFRIKGRNAALDWTQEFPVELLP